MFHRLFALGAATALLGMPAGCEVSTPPAGSPPAAAQPAEVADKGAPPSARAAPTPDEPAAAPAPPPWSKAGGLAYRELLLNATDPNTPLPMVVAIHGLGDDPDNFAHLLTNFTEPVRVILPRGIDATENGGWSWFPIRARDPDVDKLSTGIAHAAEVVAAGVAELSRSRATVGRPIVTGFSQGGMLTFTLAVHHPEVVGHAIPIGGWLPPPLMPTERNKDTDYPPIDALHGTADRAVAYEPTQAAVDTLAERGFTVKLHTYEEVGHQITPPMRRDLFDQLTDAIAREHKRKAPKQ